MTKREAKAAFEDSYTIHDRSPCTLRSYWQMFTDAISKDGTPSAYNWTTPPSFTIDGRRYPTLTPGERSDLKRHAAR